MKKTNALVQRLRRWWRAESAAYRYLAGATDHADLERRERALERGLGLLQ